MAKQTGISTLLSDNPEVDAEELAVIHARIRERRDRRPRTRFVQVVPPFAGQRATPEQRYGESNSVVLRSAAMRP